MKVLRGVVPLAVAAAIAASPAAGGGAVGPPLYPSLVNVQMVRVQKLVEQASIYEDEGDTVKAVKALTAARSHLAKAWTGAKFIIANAPPPVAGGASVSRAKVAPGAKAPAGKTVVKAKAHTSGGAIAGASPYADQFVTGIGVLSLQHEVATMALGMLDNADATLLAALSTTIFAALNARDAAITYINSITPPPVAGSGSVNAHSSGAPIATDFSALMPGVLPDTDDELQQVDGLRGTLTLSPGRKRILDAVELQSTKTARTINRLWPPLPAG